MDIKYIIAFKANICNFKIDVLKIIDDKLI